MYCMHVDDKMSIILVNNGADDLVRFLPLLQLACDPACITARGLAIMLDIDNKLEFLACLLLSRTELL